MRFSAFSPFGMFAFSGQKPLAQRIYESLKAGIDPKAFDLTPGTLEEARIYALAMGLARARLTLQRADNQRIPLKAIEKLPSLERDFGITPAGSDTIVTRQRVVAAAKVIQHGSREGAIVSALQALLGSDFVAYRATPPSLAKTWPANPATVGTYPPLNTAIKLARLTGPVNVTGVPFTVGYQMLTNGTFFFVGEMLTIEPENSSVAEQITITATGRTAINALNFTATFAKPHTVNAFVINNIALYASTQREVNVIVSASASKNAETRRKINSLMSRALRGTARWEIMAATSSTQVGPCLLGVGHNIVGATALGATAYTF